VTAEAVGKLFAHVAGSNRDDEGMGGDRRGAAAATCKIAGIAYTGSNPVPATLPRLTGDHSRGMRAVSLAERPTTLWIKAVPAAAMLDPSCAVS
jgi:hypothetical protein